MKTNLRPILFFILLGFLFIRCDEDPQSNITGEVVSHTQCKIFYNKETGKFTVADTFSSVNYTYDLAQQKLTLNHINAAFNCCPDDMYCEIQVSDDTIHIFEYEETSACDCNCLYDITEELNGIEPGTYTIQYHEPYIGDEQILIFQIQLSENSVGSFSVPRIHYPWGIN
jgi:hypothetical protein